MHFYFIKMAKDIELLGFNHFVNLAEIRGNSLTDITTEKFIQSLVVGPVIGSIRKPCLLYTSRCV